MAFDFIEGFDYYPTAVNARGVGLESTWIRADEGGGGISAMANGRFMPGKSMHLQVAPFQAWWTRVVPPSLKKVVGMALRIETLGAMANGVGSRVFGLLSQFDEDLLWIRVNNVGELRLQAKGAVDMPLPPRPILSNTWHYIELEFDMAANGRVKLYIDGEEQYEFLGNTQLNAAARVARLRYYLAGRTSSYYVDDIYCLSDVDKALGEVRIQLLEATGDFSIAFAPTPNRANYLNISEANADEDASYNASNVVGATDLFSMNQITTVPDTIHALSIVYAARKEDSGTRTVKATVQLDGQVVDGANRNLTTDYIWIRDILETGPGGTPWTKARINAAKIGYSLVL